MVPWALDGEVTGLMLLGEHARAWAVEALCFLILVGYGLVYLGLSPFFPELLAELQVGESRASVLVGGISLVNAMVGLPVIMLGARLGLRRTITLGVAFMATSVLTRWVPTYEWLLVQRLVFGLGFAFCFPTIGGIVLMWFSPQGRVWANTANKAAMGLGVAVGMFLGGMFGEGWGWRRSLSYYGLVHLVLLVLWVLLSRERRNTGEQNFTLGLDLLGWVVRSRETWIAALGMSGPFSLYVGLSTWLPTYYRVELGLDSAIVTIVTTVFALGAVPGSLLGGWMMSVWRGRRLPLFVAGIGTPLGAAILVLASSVPVFLIGSVVLGLSAFLYPPVVLTIIMELPDMVPQRVSASSGLIMSCVYTGSCLSPILVGSVAQVAGSLLPGFAILMVGSLSMLVSARLLPETGNMTLTTDRR